MRSCSCLALIRSSARPGFSELDQPRSCYGSDARPNINGRVQLSRLVVVPKISCLPQTRFDSGRCEQWWFWLKTLGTESDMDSHVGQSGPQTAILTLSYGHPYPDRHCAGIRAWLQYYGRFYRSALYSPMRQLDRSLARWADRKYRSCADICGERLTEVARISRRDPKLGTLADGCAAWFHGGSRLGRHSLDQYITYSTAGGI
jgi:hypothetical protein